MARMQSPRITWQWVRKKAGGTRRQEGASNIAARPQASRMAKSASIGSVMGVGAPARVGSAATAAEQFEELGSGRGPLAERPHHRAGDESAARLADPPDRHATVGRLDHHA